MSSRPAIRPLNGARLLPALLSAGLMSSVAAHAVNPEFQDFFFDVCANPTGTLANRCAETQDGAGNVSGDSESSLNPSQTLSSANASRSNARARARLVREPAEREPETAAPDRLELGPLSLLLNGRVISEEFDRQVAEDSERGHDLDTRGLQVGFDYRLSERWLLGAWLAWETSSLDFVAEQAGRNFTPARSAGAVEQDAIGATVFASSRLGTQGYLDLGAGLLDIDYEIERNSVFQESARSVPQTDVRTRGETDGREYWAAAVIGYGLHRGAWNFNPYAGAVYSRTRVDGYRERDLNDSGLAMAFDGMTSKSLLAQAGVRVSLAVSRPGYVLIPQFGIEYLQELESESPSTTAGFQLDAAGNRLRLTGDDRDEGFFDIGAGLVLLLPNGWMPYIEYQTTQGYRDLDRQRIAIGLRMEL